MVHRGGFLSQHTVECCAVPVGFPEVGWPVLLSGLVLHVAVRARVECLNRGKKEHVALWNRILEVAGHICISARIATLISQIPSTDNENVGSNTSENEQNRNTTPC